MNVRRRLKIWMKSRKPAATFTAVEQNQMAHDVLHLQHASKRRLRRIAWIFAVRSGDELSGTMKHTGWQVTVLRLLNGSPRAMQRRGLDSQRVLLAE